MIDDPEIRIARAANLLKPHINEDRPGASTAIRAAYQALKPKDYASKVIEAGDYYRKLFEESNRLLDKLKKEINK